MNEYSHNRLSDEELRARLRTDWKWYITAVISFLISVIAVAFILRYVVDVARGQSTPDEWLKLVAALEKQEHCLYGPDRRFLQGMINMLTVDQSARPTAWQQRWILSLKKECKLNP